MQNLQLTMVELQAGNYRTQYYGHGYSQNDYGYDYPAFRPYNNAPNLSLGYPNYRTSYYDHVGHSKADDSTDSTATSDGLSDSDSDVLREVTTNLLFPNYKQQANYYGPNFNVGRSSKYQNRPRYQPK